MLMNLPDTLTRRIDAVRHRISASRSSRAGAFWAFARYAYTRFQQDNGARQAAGLSYASLLALVPLVAIGLSILAAFPAFTPIRERLRDAILSVVAQENAGDAVQLMQSFLENAQDLTGPGVVGLMATSVLLMWNIQGALDTIWRIREPRPLATSFLVYWAVLTIGPLFLGATLTLSSYAFALVEGSGLDATAGGLLLGSRLLAVLIGTVFFSVIYFVVPNRPVEFSAALAGGATTAVLLEVLKAAFGIYLASVPSYQIVYGALATLPIFLMWMYLVWTIVLLGAEVAAGLPEWRTAARRGRTLDTPGDRLALALALLGRLRTAQREGRVVRLAQLTRGLPATPIELDQTLQRLRATGFTARTAGGRVVLTRDLAQVTLLDLLRQLDLQLDPAGLWPRSVHKALAGLHEAVTSRADETLEALLDDEGPAGPLPRQPLKASAPA